eukprot:13017879-Ditylum_brightwellii.AAC.1
MKVRGVTCMMLGYAVNHSDGVYRMWNPNTNRVLFSQDVTRLKQMYFQQHHPPAELTVNDDCLNNEDRESDGNVVSSAIEPDAGEMLGADDGVDVGDGVTEGVEEGPNKETIAGTNNDAQGNAGNDNANQDDGQWERFTQTRSGRVSKPVQRM